jgi:hypothetical protein
MLDAQGVHGQQLVLVNGTLLFTPDVHVLLGLLNESANEGLAAQSVLIMTINRRYKHLHPLSNVFRAVTVRGLEYFRQLVVQSFDHQNDRAMYAVRAFAGILGIRIQVYGMNCLRISYQQVLLVLVGRYGDDHVGVFGQ